MSECLDSVLQQTFGSYEVIIDDDRSSDESMVIANSYAKQDLRIAVHLNSSRLGLVGNFNRLCSIGARKKRLHLRSRRRDATRKLSPVKFGLLESNPAVGFVHSPGAKMEREYSDQVCSEKWVELFHALVSKSDNYHSVTVPTPFVLPTDRDGWLEG